MKEVEGVRGHRDVQCQGRYMVRTTSKRELPADRDKDGGVGGPRATQALREDWNDESTSQSINCVYSLDTTRA